MSSDSMITLARILALHPDGVYVSILSSDLVNLGTYLPPSAVYVNGLDAVRALRDALSEAIEECELASGREAPEP